LKERTGHLPVDLDRNKEERQTVLFFLSFFRPSSQEMRTRAEVGRRSSLASAAKKMVAGCVNLEEKKREVFTGQQQKKAKDKSVLKSTGENRKRPP